MKTFIIGLVSIIVLLVVLINLKTDGFLTLSIVGFSLGLPAFVFLSTLMKGGKKAKEEEDEEKEVVEEKPKKVSSSSSGGNNDVLVGLMYLIIIISFIFLIGKVSYKIIDTAGEIFSTPGVSVQEKTERQFFYKEKEKTSDKWKDGYNGRKYQVSEFKHFSGKELSFKVCGGLGCSTDFQSDAGSSTSGYYHDTIGGEKGRFEIEWNETEFSTGHLTCTTGCGSDIELFELY